MSNLFKSSREILFIDPNFSPEMSRYRKPLKRFIQQATNGNQNLSRIEYHLEDKTKANFFK